MSEHWRTVRYLGVEYPDYQVTAKGELRTRRPGRGRPSKRPGDPPWRPVQCTCGAVALRHNGGPPCQALVSTIVHETHFPHERRLRWGGRGEESAQAKLTAEDVRRVRKLVAEGVPRAVIADELGISLPHLCRIVTRTSWAHLPEGA